MYKRYFKRVFDFTCSLLAILVFSWLFVILICLGAVKMRGNPFFTQLRPGKDEKIFRLIKFRTMTCEKDSEGRLLPDDVRMTKYGKLLRKTSLDELPELLNILKGDMSIVGPRPLLVEYLPLYNDFQKRRHEVRPGLSGLAQIHGRNLISWEEKFEWDIKYIDNITFIGDMKIIFNTVWKAFVKNEGINQEGQATAVMFSGSREKIDV